MNVMGKVAIVTGASKGIGLATAKLLTEKGAKVALAARSIDKLDKISKTLPGSLAIRADMTKIDEIKSMVKKIMDHYGRIDILVNNAGQGYDAPVEKINIDTFRKIFGLNIIGQVAAMQEAIPIMRRQKVGVVVNVSSGTALMYLPNMSPYASLKRALAAISLTARTELEQDNIKVSVVYPYITDTEFEEHTIKDGIEDEDDEEGGGPPFPPDPPEHAAETILKAIETEEPEVFAHEWMEKNRKY